MFRTSFSSTLDVRPGAFYVDNGFPDLVYILDRAQKTASSLSYLRISRAQCFNYQMPFSHDSPFQSRRAPYCVISLLPPLHPQQLIR